MWITLVFTQLLQLVSGYVIILQGNIHFFNVLGFRLLVITVNLVCVKTNNNIAAARTNAAAKAAIYGFFGKEIQHNLKFYIFYYLFVVL